MNPKYRSYQLNETFLLADYCKLFKHFPYFFLGNNSARNISLPPSYKHYDKIIAGGLRKINLKGSQGFFAALEEERKKTAEWCFGYFGYDLKNELEQLDSANKDYLGFEDAGFFYPAFVFLEKDGRTELLLKENEYSKSQLLSILNSKLEFEEKSKVTIHELCPKTKYLEAINRIKEKIKNGDIYEINFCRAWSGTYESLSPEMVFLELNEMSKAPFASLFKVDELTVIGASPERFLKKEGNQLLSQPIKGTRKRSADKKLDQALKEELLNSQKEKAENVMIVDLVRNDLSKFAKKGSVKVEELFGIYTFEQVHQMISSIRSELKSEGDALKAIAGAFPMGSMTGAPKISAMKIIEENENFKRGLYSGSIGYFTEGGDFDFNVVIRSILVNTKTKNLLFAAGGAITYLSDPEEEFQESNLKARALATVLGHSL